jgi:rhamnosyltransferase
MRFAVVIPTFNAGHEWVKCVNAIKLQSLNPVQVLIIDSESDDQTVQIAKDAGFEIVQIKKKEFGHGKTRQLAVDKLQDYEFLVFMTQDAVLADNQSLANLLKWFSEGSVAAVCGRQLPRKNAGPIETHARLYNYSDKPRITVLDDANVLGLKTAFLSNSFAAYRLTALREAGGFPENVIFGEDMYVATKLLKVGYKIAYACDAAVYHSHDYTILQEFRRYFDMGVFHAREPWIRGELGKAEGEGFRFVVSELKYMFNHAPWRVPEAILRSMLRYLGFRLGRLEAHIPPGLKRNLAMNRGYFK